MHSPGLVHTMINNRRVGRLDKGRHGALLRLLFWLSRRHRLFYFLFILVECQKLRLIISVVVSVVVVLFWESVRRVESLAKLETRIRVVVAIAMQRDVFWLVVVPVYVISKVLLLLLHFFNLISFCLESWIDHKTILPALKFCK